MFEKYLRILLLLGAVALVSGAAFGHLAAQDSTPASEVDESQDPPPLETPIPPESAPPTEIPSPPVAPTDIVIESPPTELPTPIPSPTPVATAPPSNPGSAADPDAAGTPFDPTPTFTPTPTPTVTAPTATIVQVEFSPIDPASSPAVTTGIITIAFANAPTTEDWTLALTFHDFTGMGNTDAVSAATLSFLGITGADATHADFTGGVLTLSFSAISPLPTQGTLLVTVQLSIPEPFGATSYESQLSVSIAPDRST
jgi:hypothetical protein